MKIIGPHIIEPLAPHLIRSLTHGCHVSLIPRPLHQPLHIAIADQRIAIQPQLRHGSDIPERISRQFLQSIVLKIQPLEPAEVAEGAGYDLAQTISVEVELLQVWQIGEGPCLDLLDAVLVEVDIAKVRRTGER